jgi:peptide chain release factor 2
VLDVADPHRFAACAAELRFFFITSDVLLLDAAGEQGFEAEAGTDGIEFFGHSFIVDPYGRYMAQAGTDEDTLIAVETDAHALQKQVEAMEFRRMFSNPLDKNSCFIDIQAGAGGTEAQDWASMLLRQYLRYCERHEFKVDVLETSYAEEAGIKSTTFRVSAPYAYGTLSVEQGTHRLVRISPFDSQSRRHTSFAGVEIVPVVEQSDHIELDEKEVRVDVYRSSGPGGQGVNTTDSAVRLTHIPTGIVVSCQNERSQIQNKATAMAVLQSKLLERRRQEEQAKINALKGDNSGSWGNQMRSYVLAPYQMVKDLRNNHETGNTAAVLNGEIDDFIEAGLRWRRSTHA